MPIEPLRIFGTPHRKVLELLKRTDKGKRMQAAPRTLEYLVGWQHLWTANKISKALSDLTARGLVERVEKPDTGTLSVVFRLTKQGNTLATFLCLVADAKHPRAAQKLAKPVIDFYTSRLAEEWPNPCATCNGEGKV